MPTLFTLLFVACVVAVGSSPSVAQDRTGERLSDLETRVAELEAVVYGTSTPSDTAQPTPTLVTRLQSTIGGTALDLLPQGEADTIALIATGPLQHSQTPVVIRNNTDAAVTDITVKVEARDASGNLLSVGETLSNHAPKPYLLQSGDVAISFAFLEGDTDTDATFTFSVTSSPAPGIMGEMNVDVVIDEVSWQSDRVVGVIRNPTDQMLGSTYMSLVCFAADGTPILAEPATIQESIEPNGTITFQIGGGLTDASNCEHFLVAGTSHPQR